MAPKKYLATAFVISAGVAFGVFMFAPVSKTLYIKNSNSYFAAAENKIGDLADNIIPPINIPKNITENFAAMLTKDLIAENSEPRTENPAAEVGLSVPDPNAMAQKFIQDGLKQANENILNIKPPSFKTSADNLFAASSNEARVLVEGS